MLKKRVSMVALVVAACALTGCGTNSDRCGQGYDQYGNPHTAYGCTFGVINKVASRVSSNMPTSAMEWMDYVLGEGWLGAITGFSPTTFDAKKVILDTAGSSTSLKTTTGSFNLKLYQSEILLAQGSFPWKKVGTTIVSSSPDALTAWVRSFPGADGYEYMVDVQFNSTTADSITFQTSHNYQADSTSSFRVVNSAPRSGGGSSNLQQ